VFSRPKIEITALGDPLRWPHDTPLSAKIENGGQSVGIVRSLTKATEFILLNWVCVVKNMLFGFNVIENFLHLT
jgi:hypothetical protein